MMQRQKYHHLFICDRTACRRKKFSNFRRFINKQLKRKPAIFKRKALQLFHEAKSQYFIHLKYWLFFDLEKTNNQYLKQ
jgi:hypothetical protein